MTDLDVEVDAFLEHHGVKGMHWGVRTAKMIGRDTKIAAKAVGRGTMATVKWTREHKRAAASILVGAVAVGLILKGRHMIKVKDLHNRQRMYKASKHLLDMNTHKRLTALSAIAGESAPSSVKSELANKAFSSVSDRHKEGVIALAKKYGLDPKMAVTKIPSPDYSFDVFKRERFK